MHLKILIRTIIVAFGAAFIYNEILVYYVVLSQVCKQYLLAQKLFPNSLITQLEIFAHTKTLFTFEQSVKFRLFSVSLAG